MAAATSRRIVEGTRPSMTLRTGLLGAGLNVSKDNVLFIKHRNEVFDRLYKEQQSILESRPRETINVKFPDGAIREATKFTTSPLDLALSISKGLADQTIIAKITPLDTHHVNHSKIVSADHDEEDEFDLNCCENSQLWDMTRPLEFNCKLEFIKFDSEEGQHVFWHSSSHVLGASLEAEFGAHLTIGPALQRGFYYDAYLGEEIKITQEMYDALETQAKQLIKENAPFQRLVLSKQDALEIFKDNPFKVALISTKVPEGALTTCYRCGPLIDLCRGPHLVSTGKIKAFSIEKHSAVYWLGNAQGDSLQRVYAISFPDTKLMKQYKLMVEEAKKRDHRVVGNAMNLFFFETTLSPGSCFWLPDGAKIYNKLTEFIRKEYRHRGFSEVLSPNIYSCDLFKVSGHYQNYKENMYCFDVEGKEWALKPMNCPGHCLMFRHMNPSYRHLPIRMADFGVLHRNEASGSLSGLIRVRRFQQDDAHIFCRFDQIQQEVLSALEFLFFVYGVFDFKFEMKLSTRPKKALGSVELWDQAETALQNAMISSGKPWSLNPGDGAFYGPKIDIRLQDALQRWHQCGTVQLDFQLPLRFNLSYRTEEAAVKKVDECPVLNETNNPHSNHIEQHPVSNDSLVKPEKDGSWETPLRPGYARPVMIHRAILGSIERMAGVLVEHTGGKFPFWLSPKQALVCPISEKNLEYAKYVANIFQLRGYEVDVDESNNTIKKKIRQAQLDRWNYVLVVGQQEQQDGTVNVRDRDDPENQVSMTLQEVLKKFEHFKTPSSVSINDIKPFISSNI